MGEHQREHSRCKERWCEVKQKYQLTGSELAALHSVGALAGAETIWRDVCKRVGCVYETLEDAKTGDARDFLAEPIAAVVNEDVRKGCTSASNALADTLCAGRHLAQAGIPEPPSSEDASTGQRIHAALAESGNRQLMESLSVSERDMFDSCRDIEKKLVLQFFGDANQEYRVFRHERLWLPNSGQPGFIAHSGEPDVVFRAGTKALVIDYKVLTGDVADAPSNMQLRDLAVLVAGTYAPLDQVATAIVQPLVTHSPEMCLYTLDDLSRAFTELVARVRASNDPKSPRVAGAKQCQFCKAKVGCAEYNRWAGSMLPVADVDGRQLAAEGLFSVAMANWSPEQRALAASILPIAGKRLEEIKEYLKSLLAVDPSAIPGWGLKEGNNQTSIANPQQCFDRFAALGGSLPDFLGCIKVQKGKLEEAVAGATQTKGKSLKVVMTTLLDGITETKQNEPSLAKVGDK